MLKILLALRICEFVFGVGVLAVFTYLTGQPAQDLLDLPLPVALLWGPIRFIGIYYAFTGYFLIVFALASVLALKRPSVAQIVAVNAAGFLLSGWFLLEFPAAVLATLLPLWGSVLVFDALLPLVLRTWIKNTLAGQA